MHKQASKQSSHNGKDTFFALFSLGNTTMHQHTRPILKALTSRKTLKIPITRMTLVVRVSCAQ
jgi:hypothetical protein